MISSSFVPTNVLNSLFGTIPLVYENKTLRQTRSVVLHNDTGNIVTGAKIWYDNVSQEPISALRMALVEVGQDNCGSLFTESIPNGNASPVSASFTDNRTSPNALLLPTLQPGEFVGIWIERTIYGSIVANTAGGGKCEALWEAFNSEEVPMIQELVTVDDQNDSLNGKYFFLNFASNRFYIWFDTGTGVNPLIGGREGIRVGISTNDDAQTIANKVKAQIDTILGFRNLVTITLDLNNPNHGVMVFENNQAGKTFPLTVESSGFSTTIKQQGITKETEQVENIVVSIEY